MCIKQDKLLEQLPTLIKDCINGNRQAQNALYTAFAPKMLGVCMRYAKGKQEAEEVLQEGFIQVFRSLHTFKYAGSFEGWMRKIMVHCAIRHFKSKMQMHVVIHIDEHAASDCLTDDDIPGMLHKKELLAMVQALPPAYRMIFNLYVFEGMKHRE